MSSLYLMALLGHDIFLHIVYCLTLFSFKFKEYDDFDFVIESNEQTVELLNPFANTISALTLTFWMKALSGQGNIFSYHQLADDGNISSTDIEVFNPQDVTVRIKG